MFVTKVLSLAFVAGLAVAQSCSTSATTTVANAADATALGSLCTAYTGSIAVATSAVGPIDFGSLQTISGNLVADGATNLTSLTANSVTTIGGTLLLNDVTVLSTLSFRFLTAVGGLSFVTVPNLQSLIFSSTLSRAGNVLITDTGLTTLAGIDLLTTGDFEITNNPSLSAYSTGIVNITTALTISGNGYSTMKMDLAFPNLLIGHNMTMRNISSLSIPALSAVLGTFGVYSSSLTSLTAPNLTVINGDLAVIADPALTNISMPLLTSISGGLVIANDTSLVTINGFPELSKTGALNIAGNYSTLLLPALTYVAGSANLQSSAGFSCDPFDKYAANRIVIKGVYYCRANSNNVQSTIGSSTTGSSTSSTGSAGAAVGAVSVNLPAVFGLSLLVGGLIMVGGLVQLL